MEATDAPTISAYYLEIHSLQQGTLLFSLRGGPAPWAMTANLKSPRLLAVAPGFIGSFLLFASGIAPFAMTCCDVNGVPAAHCRFD